MNEQVLQAYVYTAGVLGGILFWVGFLIFGFIARRYNVVFNKPTFHGLLMTAPSGILLYSILLIIKTTLKSTQASDVIQITAYILLIISAVLCLFGIYKFNSLLTKLMKYKGKE